MNLYEARDSYLHDPMFKRVVDTIAQWIIEMHVTPAEARSAAMLAAIRVEETRVSEHLIWQRSEDGLHGHFRRTN